MKLVRRKRLIRLLIVSLPLVWFVAGLRAPQAQPLSSAAQSAADFDQLVLPFLSTNCYLCHNAQLKSGGLNLEAYKTAVSIAQNRETWEKIIRKLQAGEMPPKGRPRPDAAELKTVIGWIE